MPYNYLTINNDDLNYGIVSASYFGKDDQSLYEQSILDSQKFFGDNDDDVIEITVYSENESSFGQNIIVPKTTYSVLQGSYRDINNDPKKYDVKNPYTNYVINKNELLLHTQQDLKFYQLTPGLYTILYNPMRYIAGNPDNRLFIKEISPSRTEIRLSYAFNTTVNESSRLDSVKISSFANKKYTFLQLIDEIIPIIDKNTIHQNFNKEAENTNLLKYAQFLGFKSLADLQDYIYITYIGYNKTNTISNNNDVSITQTKKIVGVAEQLRNFVYTYNTIEYTSEEILLAFKAITTKVSQDFILQKTTLSTQDLEETINVFTTIIYDYWLLPQITNLLNEYYTKFYGLYKNAINFGDGNIVKILDHTSYFNNINNSFNIQIKLDSPLPSNYDLKTTCWISNISLSPIYFKVSLYTAPISRKVYLDGVNFSVSVNSVRPTNDYPSNESVRGIQKSKENLKKKINDLVIDYTDFSNFINFSSAELRSKIAKNKVLNYQGLESKKQNVSLTANSVNNSSISASFIFEYNKIVDEQISLLDTFDEYESYLFYNTSSIDEKIKEGIIYDKNNYNSLLYQLPDYIKEGQNYGDYLKFTSMVGHIFDNILVYIKKFPKNYPIDLNDSNSYPKNYVEELLNSFNWNVTNFKFDRSNTSQLYFNSSESSGSLSSSYFDYAKSIFNRIANNLSYIYKTKGNATSFNLIQNIFGIPNGLINITEYTTPSVLVNRDIFYDFDEKIYAVTFDNNQYINFDVSQPDYINSLISQWSFGSSSLNTDHLTSSYQEQYFGVSTIELSFRSDQYKRYNFKDKIDLIKKYRNGDTDWKIYLDKTKQQLSAKLVFELSPSGSSDSVKITSEELPFFNGNFYTFMIKREIDPNISIDNLSLYTQSIDANNLYIIEPNSEKFVPHKYTLSVNQYYGSQLKFTDTKTKNVGYSFNRYFSSGSYYVGNYSSSTNFYGNIDKIKVQKYALDQEDFKEHCYNINSISIPNKNLVYENMYYLWSFDTPVNLYSGSGMSVIDNQNNRYSTKFYAYNFEQVTINRGYPYCDTISTDKFPYQFGEFNIKQSINSNKFGPNYKGNANINKITQLVSSNLVPYDYSTYTNDIIGSDSNLLGYYISPYQYLNTKIEDFLGKEGIGDIIGDPKYINARNYTELKTRQEQFASSTLKYIYPQEFYSTYKFYIDFSVFEFVKNLTPSRSSLKTGLLLEPSIFDRKKFNYKDAIFNVDSADNSVYNLPFDINAKFTSSIFDTNESSSNTNISITYINSQKRDTNTSNYYYTLINDKLDDRDFIYCNHGKYVGMSNNGFFVRNVSMTPKNEYYMVNDNSNGLYETFTSSFYEVNFIGSGSGLLINQVTGSKLLNKLYSGSFGGGYSDRHLSKFVRVGTRVQKQAINVVKYNTKMGVRTKVASPTISFYTYIKGENSSQTTVNRSGERNGSKPVLSISGFLDLDQESDNFPVYGTLDENNSGIFIPTAITASLATSASLENYIMNL